MNTDKTTKKNGNLPIIGVRRSALKKPKRSKVVENNEIRNMTRITRWMYPNGIMPSMYGKITKKRWAEKEVARLLRAGIRAKVEPKGRFIAVFRD
jgi:hypothetical protein